MESALLSEPSIIILTNQCIQHPTRRTDEYFSIQEDGKEGEKNYVKLVAQISSLTTVADKRSKR